MRLFFLLLDMYDVVLYLDMFSKKVETYNGDYWFVKSEIQKKIKKVNAMNAQLKKKAQEKKDQANKFANKGGNLRKVAKTMRTAAEEMEEKMEDVRREDYQLSNFSVPFYASSPSGKILRIEQVSSYDKQAKMSEPIELGRGDRVRVIGPNGIGKTTFLEMIVNGTASGVTMDDTADIGYYRKVRVCMFCCMNSCVQYDLATSFGLPLPIFDYPCKLYVLTEFQIISLYLHHSHLPDKTFQTSTLIQVRYNA